ncbi:MAG TPA: hypothetical protein DC049_16800, partial [Spirochaetia bacterium]|nr:hypothetical protein [Spirochaetia bacterium]
SKTDASSGQDFSLYEKKYNSSRGTRDKRHKPVHGKTRNRESIFTARDTRQPGSRTRQEPIGKKYHENKNLKHTRPAITEKSPPADATPEEKLEFYKKKYGESFRYLQPAPAVTRSGFFSGWLRKLFGKKNSAAR